MLYSNSGDVFNLMAVRALRIKLCVLCMAMLFAGSGLGGPIIQYQATNLGMNASGETVIAFSYTLTGLDLLTNQELDIQFPVATFTQLSNGVAGPGFDLGVFQPNQPVGVEGDYAILAIVDNPSLAGPFTVDATLVPGFATPPSSQPFVIYNDNVTPSAVVLQGTATAVASAVPEPSAMLLCGSGLLVIFAADAMRRRRRQTP
jgi:hypothetical protein